MFSRAFSKAQPKFRWFSLKGYFQGVFWTIPAILTSNMNDILTRFSGTDLPPQEVTFFRYFFAALTILPIMLWKGKKSFYTKRPLLHAIRSIFLFIAIFCWTKGLTMSHLIVGGIFAQTTQIFVFLMAFIFLKESVNWQKTFAVFIGFLGVIIVAIGDSDINNLLNSFFTRRNSTLFFLTSTIFFALSDIVNKYFVNEEPLLPMLFYIYLGTMILSLYPTVVYWKTPSFQNLGHLSVLGLGGNALLFFLLRSFKATDVSALISVRYIEIFSAGILGYLFFSEIPSLQTFLGAFLVIISATIMSVYGVTSSNEARKNVFEV